MMASYIAYLRIVGYLLAADLKIFKQTIGAKIFDLLIWASSVTFASTYLLPAFGLATSYANFIVSSLAASAGLFEVFPSIAKFIHDIEGQNVTSFYLTLPLPSWMVFLRNIIFYSINTATLGFFVLPVSVLISWNRIHLPHFNWGKYIVIFIIVNIFYACASIWLASFTKNIEKIGSVWMRFVWPAWYFGGFQFSWKVLYTFNYVMGYIVLLNPMTYVLEGTRNAILGPQTMLPFAACVIMIIFFGLLFSWHGILRLKRRLDFC